MTKKQREARERAACELVTDALEGDAGYEIDPNNCYVDDHERDGDAWVTLRVRVPGADIGDRVTKMKNEGR